MRGWRAVGKLGAGAEGVVHEVVRADGTRGALKRGSHPDVRHPNVVGLLDRGWRKVVLELVEGPALDVWLARYTPAPDEAHRLFAGIVAGVQHLHERGLVHGDLKPGNVLLTPRLVPKVTDLAGRKLGTPRYMAPEQRTGAATPRSDVFGLGTILYELLTGQHAFEGIDNAELFDNIDAGFYAPLPLSVPDSLVRVVAGCLDPTERWADCAAVLDGLGPSPPGDFSAEAYAAARAR